MYSSSSSFLQLKSLLHYALLENRTCVTSAEENKIGEVILRQNRSQTYTQPVRQKNRIQFRFDKK